MEEFAYPNQRPFRRCFFAECGDCGCGVKNSIRSRTSPEILGCLFLISQIEFRETVGFLIFGE
ncbi:MAG: hypothetical protein A3J76_01335 [Candidatus Moranbacteria bacterium RBG_13_45_13]|nr:MAG: hypothetical protein A3J76_01335 [Candidatus Moranbacteria bacterium RBG_13_45_13]